MPFIDTAAQIVIIKRIVKISMFCFCGFLTPFENKNNLKPIHAANELKNMEAKLKWHRHTGS